MKVVQKMIADSIRREELAIEKQKGHCCGRGHDGHCGSCSKCRYSFAHPGDPAAAGSDVPKDNNKPENFMDELSARSNQKFYFQ
jgi:hypothetical protein